MNLFFYFFIPQIYVLYVWLWHRLFCCAPVQFVVFGLLCMSGKPNEYGFYFLFFILFVYSVWMKFSPSLFGMPNVSTVYNLYSNDYIGIVSAFERHLLCQMILILWQSKYLSLIEHERIRFTWIFMLSYLSSRFKDDHLEIFAHFL